MRSLFHESLTVMDNAFHRLEKQVPPPELKEFKKGVFAHRYKEQTIEQALILKFARAISGLRALDTLLFHGFVQEQAVIQRTLDEIHDDIHFLAAALTNDKVTEMHKQYLKAFYAEAFPDPNNTLARAKKPSLPPRRKIQSYLIRVFSTDPDPSRQLDVTEILSRVYSGYVHASSSQIMDMYGGESPHFHLSGLMGTPRIQEYMEDAWNYFYRGFLAAMTIGKAFGDKPLVDAMYKFLPKFETVSGNRTKL